MDRKCVLALHGTFGALVKTTINIPDFFPAPEGSKVAEMSGFDLRMRA